MEWHGDRWLAEMERRVRRAVEAGAIDLKNDIRARISIPSRTVTQSTYTRGKKKGQTKKVLGVHGSNRSLPGEPPHKETGTLRSSIAYLMEGSEPMATVGSALKVARWMELGRPGGTIIRPKKSKWLSWVEPNGQRRFAKSVKQGAIAPRPFIRPALADAQPKIIQRINAALNASSNQQ